MKHDIGFSSIGQGLAKGDWILKKASGTPNWALSVHLTNRTSRPHGCVKRFGIFEPDPSGLVVA
jgi:hypothetical protein